MLPQSFFMLFLVASMCGSVFAYNLSQPLFENSSTIDTVKVLNAIRGQSTCKIDFVSKCRKLLQDEHLCISTADIFSSFDSVICKSQDNDENPFADEWKTVFLDSNSSVQIHPENNWIIQSVVYQPICEQYEEDNELSSFTRIKDKLHFSSKTGLLPKKLFKALWHYIPKTNGNLVATQHVLADLKSNLTQHLNTSTPLQNPNTLQKHFEKRGLNFRHFFLLFTGLIMLISIRILDSVGQILYIFFAAFQSIASHVLGVLSSPQFYIVLILVASFYYSVHPSRSKVKDV